MAGVLLKAGTAYPSRAHGFTSVFGGIRVTIFLLFCVVLCPMKVITVRDTSPYGHAPTYQISLTYLERQKCYGPDKKILFKKQLFDLEVKG
jgi:hypothetical protein